MAQQVVQRVEPPGSARLVMVSGAVLLRPEEAVFEAMLAGWRAQQQSRMLAASTVDGRERLGRRFAGLLPGAAGPGSAGGGGAGAGP